MPFVRFFRSSFATQHIFVAATGLLLWGAALFRAPAMPEPAGPVPLYTAMYEILHDVPVLPVLLGWAVALFSAFLLNYLLVTNEIVSKNTSLSGFLFITFTSFLPDLLVLNPVSLCMLMLLLILSSLFSFYHRPDALDLVYMAGFITGIGALIYAPFSLFFFLVPVSLILFRSSNWREWLASLIGLLTPFLFLSAGYFWFDILQEKALEWIRSFELTAFPSGPFRFDWLVFSSLIVLLTISGWLNSMIHLSDKTIEIRKKNILINWVPIFIAGSYFFESRNETIHVLLFAGIAAIFTSVYLLQLKRSFWQEMILLLLFLSIFANILFANG